LTPKAFLAHLALVGCHRSRTRSGWRLSLLDLSVVSRVNLILLCNACHLNKEGLMSLVTIYLCLAAAILAEVIGTTALAASESFSKPLPSIISVVCFVAAFWLLSFPLRTMPTGIVYAVWSGLGIVLITAVAWVWAKQALDVPALIGMALITAGVIVMNVFSKSVLH
jgi:small multidrug resistance pump